MQGVGKRQIWGNGFLAIPGYNTADGAIPDAIASDYWTEENTGAFYARPWNQSGSNDAYNYYKQSRYSAGYVLFPHQEYHIRLFSSGKYHKESTHAKGTHLSGARKLLYI